MAWLHNKLLSDSLRNSSEVLKALVVCWLFTGDKLLQLHLLFCTCLLEISCGIDLKAISESCKHAHMVRRELNGLSSAMSYLDTLTECLEPQLQSKGFQKRPSGSPKLIYSTISSNCTFA